MPFLTINTNVKNSNVNLAYEAAELVAKILKKPISYVVVTINDQQIMSFGDDVANKGALLEMRSIGFANKNELAQKLTDFMIEHFNVEAEFVNIEFVNLAAADVAIAGNLLG